MATLFPIQDVYLCFGLSYQLLILCCHKLNLQQDSTINSPRRQNLVSTPVNKTTNIQTNQYLDTSNEDNQPVYSGIFDDDDSEDFGDISNTSNSNLITSRGAYNRHTDVRISKNGSIYLDLNAVNGENNAGSLEELPVILVEGSMKKSVYDDDLWEDASQT